MRKNVFIKAIIITVLIFIAGLSAGMWLDNSRTEEIRERLAKVDIDWNDARLQSTYYQIFSNDTNFCNSAMRSNAIFADKIYEEGLILERYEAINRFSPYVISEKKRYALLQMQFWMNSIELKESCNTNYSTVLYLYSHYADGDQKNDQNLMSAILTELKNDCGSNVMLSPIPIDIELASISAIADQFDIDVTPSILINENDLIQGVTSLEELKDLVGC
jgi:hypothetical protein